jgi:hypothetical protein
MRLSCLITCWVLLINLDSNLRKYRMKTFQSIKQAWLKTQSNLDSLEFRCKQV